MNAPAKSETAKWPQPVIRVRTTYDKTVYVQAAEWKDKGCEKLREMMANGWPRRFYIARRKIVEEVGEPRSLHPERCNGEP